MLRSGSRMGTDGQARGSLGGDIREAGSEDHPDPERELRLIMGDSWLDAEAIATS